MIRISTRARLWIGSAIAAGSLIYAVCYAAYLVPRPITDLAQLTDTRIIAVDMSYGTIFSGSRTGKLVITRSAGGGTFRGRETLQKEDARGLVKLAGSSPVRFIQRGPITTVAPIVLAPAYAAEFLRTLSESRVSVRPYRPFIHTCSGYGRSIRLTIGRKTVAFDSDSMNPGPWTVVVNGKTYTINSGVPETALDQLPGFGNPPL